MFCNTTNILITNRCCNNMFLFQVDVDLKGQVIDSFWLVKQQHKPYNIE